MRATVQRVNSASVSYGNVKQQIGKGIVVFIAVGHEDTEEDVEYIAKKVVNLRIFENEQGKMDYSVIDIKGEIMIISEFTLYGDCKKGNRPDFTSAAKPDIAEKIYNMFIEKVKSLSSGIKCVTGKFKEYMIIELSNDGPVTLILDSKN
ncbi:MAG: D-aminoacyl-tRNA deacylase [Endomicrobia bacterium]|nr:D-aminoacyl-tRNA deacylase [Endomicrobiia bacterium]